MSYRIDERDIEIARVKINREPLSIEGVYSLPGGKKCFRLWQWKDMIGTQEWEVGLSRFTCETLSPPDTLGTEDSAKVIFQACLAQVPEFREEIIKRQI